MLAGSIDHVLAAIYSKHLPLDDQFVSSKGDIVGSPKNPCSFVLLLLALCSSLVEGWSILPKLSLKRKPTVEQHYSRSIDDQTSLYVSSDISLPVLTIPPHPPSPAPSVEVSVRSVHLPKHAPPQGVVQRAKMLLDFEIIFGRAAMLASLMLFVGEVCFGWDMPSLLGGGGIL
eukprot:scaffold2004_cov101-Cylindrotheca_fusiformis.AAC.6